MNKTNFFERLNDDMFFLFFLMVHWKLSAIVSYIYSFNLICTEESGQLPILMAITNSILLRPKAFEIK